MELPVCQWAQVAGSDEAWISDKQLCLGPGFSNGGVSYAQRDRDQGESQGTPGADPAAVTEAESPESPGQHVQDPGRVCLLLWMLRESGLPRRGPDTREATIKERKYTPGVGV